MISRGTGEPLGENQSPAADRKAPGFAATLKKQFRECVKHLTGKAPAQEPKPRRRRTGETRGGFILAAVNIVGRRIRLPAAAYEAAAFLSHTLDWLNPWHHDATSGSELNEDFHYEEPTNHLSPHL